MSARWIWGGIKIANEARSAELAITISHPTSANGIIVLLNFLNSKRLVVKTKF